MEYIFDNWKKILEDFQNSVEKDLDEIHQQKAAVEQIKDEVYDRLEKGLFYRDDNRIVISAPEIVIGNVDKSGTLLDGGVGSVIIKGSAVDLEGVGEYGQITSRAPIIHQTAVNPGTDGLENVVCDNSEIVSQAGMIALHSSQDKDAFLKPSIGVGNGGISIHADQNLSIEASISAVGKKAMLENQIEELTATAKELKEKLNDQKQLVDDSFKEMTKLLDEEAKLNNDEDFATRVNVYEIEEIHEQMEQIMPAIFSATQDFIQTISRLAEANRAKKALEAQKDAIKTGDDFTKKTTGASLKITAEAIEVATRDGDGNTRTNDEAGISVRTPNMSIGMADDKGALVEGSSLTVAAENFKFSSTNPSSDGKELPVVGTFRVQAKNVDFDGLDYKADDKGLTEKQLNADSKFVITAKTVQVDTTSPKDIERDDKGKLTKGEYTAEGDVIIKSKTISMETLDYEVADGKLKTKALTKDSKLAVRTEKMDFLSADAEGKAAGSITMNAKAVSVKSMDLDKEKLTDTALAAGSTMLLLSEKMFVGAKDKSIKSKKLQAVSEEAGVFADKTLEIQQGDGKALVQLADGNASMGGSKSQIYGETTINAKTEIKGELKVPKATIDGLEVKSAFKSPNISDGMGGGAAGGGGSLSAKLKTEDAPKEG